MQTYSAKPSEIEAKWWIVDAEDAILGRLAANVATLLRGKHKPAYTPHIDCGDHVVVINADKVKMTGRKRTDKTYYRHTGYPGGIKETTPAKLVRDGKGERVVLKSIERMLPKDSPLARQQFSKLRVYAGAEHPHTAQKPQVLDLAAKNPKNKR